MTYTVRPISDRTAFTGSSVDSRFTVNGDQTAWDQVEQAAAVLGLLT